MANRNPRASLRPAVNGQVPRHRRTRRVDVFADDLDPRTERRLELLRRVMEEPPVARPQHPRWLIRS
jgi:hypothetical protein